MLKFRVLPNNLRVLVRFYHNENKEVSSTEKKSMYQTDMDYTPIPKETNFGSISPLYWNERSAVRKQRRNQSIFRTIDNVPDLIRSLQNLRNFPKTLPELLYFLRRRRENKMLCEQQFLKQREAVLRPDLAAAHFITNLGGAVKFLGKPEWIGFNEEKKLLPSSYIPGLFVEAIKADNSDLIHEGLPNMRKLKYLTSLSLKNLKTINDWSMDWISKEYYLTLKHLDISGCINVSYRGLSCFYRFECLESLNVEGIPETTEFKVACLMLLENLPYLDIKGINLDIPEKIDLNEVKHISSSQNEIQEVKT